MSEISESTIVENEKRRNVLVLSRHVPKIGQLSEIRRMNGENCLITLDNQRYQGVRDVIERFDNGGYDDLAIVGPRDVIADLILSGIKPIHLISYKINPAQKTTNDYLNPDGTCSRYLAERACGFRLFYERNFIENDELIETDDFFDEEIEQAD
ncbi:MAG TPA: hypothetical protein PKN62_00470 [bacterium]|nr:hypothetical protein [bacterium]